MLLIDLSFNRNRCWLHTCEAREKTRSLSVLVACIDISADNTFFKLLSNTDDLS